ncbi:MAG TPA: hypothetical protein EYP87_05805 [Flavobacteriaceae bacterium]|nr:hypothetical protein [Flavobacteriaceae bacterium]
MKSHFIIISLIVTASSALGKLLFNEMIPQWANLLLLLLIFTLSVSILILQNPIQKLLKLSSITNNIPKNNATITTVKDFLETSKEESLKKGDNVKILTNNLTNYDLLDATIDILADNLSEGVCYEYYLPLDSDLELKSNLEELIEKISTKTNINAFMNLKIYKTKHPLLFSYAIVKNNNLNQKTTNGYWYIATSGKDKNLTIVSIEGESKYELINVFNSLKGQEVDVIEIAKKLQWL